MPLTDNSPMPFGKWAGKKMIDVPASYLIWMYDEISKSAPNKMSFQQKLIFDYVEMNWTALEKERDGK